MDPIVFVEVMDRLKQVRQRIAVSQFPVTIGRAYSNGIIIDDPNICPVHARIEYNDENEIVIVDTDSINGINNSGKTKDTFKVSPQRGLTVKLGNTTIRIRSPEFIPEATIVRGLTGSPLRDIIDKNPYISLLALFPLSYLFLSTYLLSTENFIDSGMPIFFATCFNIVLWVSGWALLNRILSARFNFFPHLLLISSAGLVFGIAYTLTSYLSFLIRMDVFSEILSNGVILSIASLLLFGHLSIVGNIRIRTRLMFNAGSIILVGLTYMIFFFQFQTEYNPNISFNSTLKPIKENLLPSVSHKDFFNETKDLVYKLKKEP
jgi:FHA domain-containing protein